MKNENNPTGIILIHTTALAGTAFDFLVRKDKAKEYEWLKELCYTVEDCPYVKKWLKTHPNYTYIASEDLQHIPEINMAVIKLIEKLKKEGFKVRCAYDH